MARRTPVGSDIPVIIRFYDGRQSSGAMTVRHVGVGLRLGRALRSLLICWVFAVVAVLVPFLHWVLVPAIGLLGPVLAVLAFRNDRQVSGGGGICPVCGAAVAFARTARPEAFSCTCAGCRSGLEAVWSPDRAT